MFNTIMSYIPDFLREYLRTVYCEPSVLPVTLFFRDMLNAIDVALPYIVLIASLIIGFFGKRLFPYIRSIIFFGAGFVGGMLFCAPFVQQYIPAIPQLAVGIALGLLLAVLSRFVYNVLYVGAAGLGAFALCFYPLIPQLAAYTHNNLPVCIAVGVVVALIVLLLRKYIEMVATASVSAWLFAFVTTLIFDYPSYFPVDRAISMAVVEGALAVTMVIYQYKTRIRY